MKKLILMFVLLAPLSYSQIGNGNLVAAAATCVTTVGATQNCVNVALSGGQATAAINISGTFVATVNFEAVVLPGTPVPLLCTPYGTSTSVTSTTAAGTWKCSVPAAASVQVRIGTGNYTSGTAVAIVRVSTASAGSSSSSSSASGFLTGASLPATCSVGQVYMLTAVSPAVPYKCTVTDTWVAFFSDPTVIYASQLSGVKLDCNLTTGLTAASAACTDNSTALNNAISGASATNPIKLIIDGGTGMGAALTIPAVGYVDVEGIGWGSGFFMNAGANSSCVWNGFVFTYQGGPFTPPTSGNNVRIANLRCNGNRGTFPNGNSNRVDARGNPFIPNINIQNINGLIVDHIYSTSPPLYGVYFANVNYGYFTNSEITDDGGSNNDGFHVTGPASYIFIQSDVIHSYDSSIAIVAYEGYQGAIHDVYIDNVDINNALGVLVSACYRNAGANPTLCYQVNNILISHLTGFSNTMPLQIGVPTNNSGAIPAGYIRNVHLSDSEFYGQSTIVQATEPVDDLKLSNITHTSPFGSNGAVGGGSTSAIFVLYGSYDWGAPTSIAFGDVSCTNCKIIRAAGEAGDPTFLKWAVVNTASIQRLSFTDSAIIDQSGTAFADTIYAFDFQAGSVINNLDIDGLSQQHIATLYNSGTLAATAVATWGKQVATVPSTFLTPNQITVALVPTPGTPVVTPVTAGTKNYSYKIVAVLNDGSHSAATAAGSTTTGKDNLATASFGNALTWACSAGTFKYQVYRTVAGGTTTNTTGLIATVYACSYTDIGVAGDSATPPTTNTTGVITGDHFVGSGMTLSSTGSRLDINNAANNAQIGILAANLHGTTLTLDSIAINYNGINLASGGFPAIYGTSDLTGQTAALTSTALYTPASTGMYRVSYYAKVTTPGTTSILGGTTGFVLNYTDGTDSVAQTVTLAGDNQSGGVISIGTGNTTNTTAAVYLGSAMVYAKTGVAMTYNFGYSSTGTTMAYEIHVKIESL